MGEAKPLVPVIVGPTASGKTDTAVALASLFPLTVISADSRQVYRGLDIGTAKPERGLLARVPHVGLDLVDVGERFSAGRFARAVRSWLASIQTGRQPVMVGGTGFYIKAVADGLFREPAVDAHRHQRLHRWSTELPDVEAWARRLDPEFRGGGRQRAARGVEIALRTGRSLSWWQRHSPTSGVIRPWYVWLRLPKDTVYGRIAIRTATMLRSGWIEEVENLLRHGTPSNAAGLNAVGYREVVAYLTGRLKREDLEGAINTATRQYAKRQQTWFRHQLQPHAVLELDATQPVEQLAHRITDTWRGVRERCESA